MRSLSSFEAVCRALTRFWNGKTEAAFGANQHFHSSSEARMNAVTCPEQIQSVQAQYK
jgi:hypothetical protein